MKTKMFYRTGLAAVMLLGLLLTGCGQSPSGVADDTSTATPSPTAEAAIEVEAVKMPDLTGMHYAEAKNALLDLMLDLDISESTETDNGKTDGEVISTIPAAGVTISRGYTVVITYAVTDDNSIDVGTEIPDQPLNFRNFEHLPDDVREGLQIMLNERGAPPEGEVDVIGVEVEHLDDGRLRMYVFIRNGLNRLINRVYLEPCTIMIGDQVIASANFSIDGISVDDVLLPSETIIWGLVYGTEHILVPNADFSNGYSVRFTAKYNN